MSTWLPTNLPRLANKLYLVVFMTAYHHSTYCVLVFVSIRQRLCCPILNTHAYFMLFLNKFVASKHFPPKSLMPRVTSNLLTIKHPTSLIPQHDTSPGNVFVNVASSVANLKFLEDNLLIPSSGVKNPTRSPETSVRNYHYSLRNNPDESSSHLLRGGSLKSCLKFRFPMHINLTLFNSTVLKCRSSLSNY
jgi:hypothetical protein